MELLHVLKFHPGTFIPKVLHIPPFHPGTASHPELPSWNFHPGTASDPELLSWNFLSFWNSILELLYILNFHPGTFCHPGTRLAPLIKTTRLSQSPRHAFFPRNYHFLLILVVWTSSQCTLSTVCLCAAASPYWSINLHGFCFRITDGISCKFVED